MIDVIYCEDCRKTLKNEDLKFDLIFTCPPYYDLEVYSDNQNDLSNMGTYEQFIESYRDIINKSVAQLKEDRFAVCVVGDMRDNKGNSKNIKEIFREVCVD